MFGNSHKAPQPEPLPDPAPLVIVGGFPMPASFERKPETDPSNTKKKLRIKNQRRVLRANTQGNTEGLYPGVG